MLSAAYRTVSDIELLWCGVALVGAIFSVFNLREARRDRQRLVRLNIANGRSKLAKANLISESARLTKQVIFLGIGLIALFLAEVPDSLDQPWPIALAGFLIRWGLITASVLTAYQSYLAFRVRRDILRG